MNVANVKFMYLRIGAAFNGLWKFMLLLLFIGRLAFSFQLVKFVVIFTSLFKTNVMNGVACF